MQPIVFDLPESRRLVDVKREWRAKGSVWAAEDVRRQLLAVIAKVDEIALWMGARSAEDE